MKHWKEALAALIGTLSLLGLSFVGAALLVKIVTALCGVGFSWTVAAAVWLALLLCALRLLIRLGAEHDKNREARK